MPGHPSWRLLPAAAPGIPKLLVSAVFTDDSYFVRLSDLANVWTESLERKPIITRGLVEDTSIDPSDGPDQIRRMLELLRAAFDHADPEHHNTSLAIASGDDRDSLKLHVTCILPEPLKPFKWPMHLKRGSPSAIASDLVIPLIQAHEARLREIGQLTSLLREKDAVISRLIDKLEATGVGLEHVFNALSGRRRPTRAAAEDKVKGLAPFSETDFRNKAAEPRPLAQPSDVPALLSTVFGASGLKYQSDLEIEASAILDDWWTKLAKGKNVILSERLERTEAQTSSTTPPKPPRKEDDDFQVQVTPPGLRPSRRGGRTSQAVPGDDETSDGEGTAEGSNPSPAPAKPQATRTRLGTVGRNARPGPSSPPANNSPMSLETKTVPADAHSETASEEDVNEHGSSPPVSPPKPAPRRAGLGHIGGRPTQDAPASKKARSPSVEAPATDASPLPRRHKLGMIGKKAPSHSPTRPAESTSDDQRGRSKTPAAEPKTGQLRETSQERADRKRAELQREMEKRAAAGPAKKKRKF